MCLQEEVKQGSCNPVGLDCSAPAIRGSVGASLTWKPGVLSLALSILHDAGPILATCHGGAQLLSLPRSSLCPLSPALGCSSHTELGGTTSIAEQRP